MIWRLLLAAASPAGQRARLSVLIFHRVLPAPDPLFPAEVDVRRFDALCGWIARNLQVLPLPEAVQHLRRGSLPARAAAITFDDGYADNHDHALPILQRHHLPASFFVASGFLDGGCMWNDRIIEAVRLAEGSYRLRDLLSGQPAATVLQTASDRRRLVEAAIAQAKYLPDAERLDFVTRLGDRLRAAAPQRLMMTPAQVQALHRAGMTIGAHTLTHPILACLAIDAARREIVAGRSVLEDLIGERVGLFAYPNGKPGQDYRSEHVELVRALGFDAAVSTAWGASGNAGDLFQIRRFTPWDRALPKFGLRLASNLLRRGMPLVA